MQYKIFLFMGVISNVVAQFALKRGMSQIDQQVVSAGILAKVTAMLFSFWCWLGLAAYGLGFVLYSIVLTKIDLSKAYPVSSTAVIVLIALVSFVFLGEKISTYKIAGLVLCMAGIFLIFIKG